MFYLYRRLAGAQEVNRRAVSAEDRVRSQVSPCEVFVKHTGIGTGFLPRTSFFLCLCHYINAPYTSSATRPSYQKETWRSLRTFQK
jgi:hypothetical protein